MGSTPSVLFRQALAALPRGTPLSTQLLRDRGLTAKQVGRLAESGWLRRLGRGVYLLPGDELSREATLAWLGTQVPGLHVAGKTALGWRAACFTVGSAVAPADTKMYSGVLKSNETSFV